MNFQISGLDAEAFHHLFGQSPEILAEYGVERMTVESHPGYPCRVSLQDAEIGETVLLMNYEHLPTSSPYRSSHAIFVKEGAGKVVVGKNQIPEVLRIRLLSIRAFDAEGMMIDADVVDGQELEVTVKRMLSIESVAYLHMHSAQRGCFIARCDRA